MIIEEKEVGGNMRSSDNTMKNAKKDWEYKDGCKKGRMNTEKKRSIEESIRNEVQEITDGKAKGNDRHDKSGEEKEKTKILKEQIQVSEHSRK